SKYPRIHRGSHDLERDRLPDLVDGLQCRRGQPAHSEGGRDHPVVRRPASHEECHVVKYEVPSYDEIRDLRRSVAKLEDDLDDLREQLDEIIRYLKGGAGDEEGLPVGR